MERVSVENSGDKAWFEDESSVENSSDNNSSEEGGTDVATSGRVYAEIEHLDHDILKVTVKCEKIETPVLGLAFHLEYQKDLLHFLRYDPGNFLEQGGDPFYIVTDNNSAVILGETLRRDDSFPVEGGDVVEIYFQKDASYDETSIIEFKFKNGVVSGMDSTRQDIDRINFEDFSSAKIVEENASNKALNEEKVEAIVATNTFAGNFQQYLLGVLSTFGIIFLVLASVIFIKYIKARRKI